MTDRLTVLEGLKNLNAGQFENIVVIYGMPTYYMSGNSPIERAICLMRYAESKNDLGRLHDIIENINKSNAPAANANIPGINTPLSGSAHEQGQAYDVFLCHNSADKPQVRQLYKLLVEKGIVPWMDETDLIPGRPWQDELEKQIKNIKTVSVLVGNSGFGPWQNQEMRAFINQFVKRKVPVIPTLLPGISKVPELPPFLEAFTWVDCSAGFNDENIARLLWGIRGTK